MWCIPIPGDNNINVSARIRGALSYMYNMHMFDKKPRSVQTIKLQRTILLCDVN